MTAFGREIVAEYYAMEEKASAAIAPDLERFAGHLRKGASVAR